MRLIQVEDYSGLSLESAQFVIDLIKENPAAVISCATGSSPTGMYAEIAKAVREQNLDCSRLTIVKLDEWGGLDMQNPATCEAYLQKHVLHPLNIPTENYISFQSDAEDPDKECQRIKEVLEKLGKPIDLVILGIGLNGHLAMNEPGSDPDSHAHVVSLTDRTLAHKMLEGNSQTVTHGLTLGIRDILDSKTALLLVSGASKKSVFKKLRDGEVSSGFPASYLWKHPDCVCIADKEAYGL